MTTDRLGRHLLQRSRPNGKRKKKGDGFFFCYSSRIRYSSSTDSLVNDIGVIENAHEGSEFFIDRTDKDKSKQTSLIQFQNLTGLDWLSFSNDSSSTSALRDPFLGSKRRPEKKK